MQSVTQGESEASPRAKGMQWLRLDERKPGGLEVACVCSVDCGRNENQSYQHSPVSSLLQLRLPLLPHQQLHRGA
jgi:hypothetical protein